MASLFGIDVSLLLIVLSASGATAGLALVGLSWASRGVAPLIHVPTQTLPIEHPIVETGLPTHDPIDRAELESLRLAAVHTQTLLWRRDCDGVVTWTNKAYLDAVDKISADGSRKWPVPDLFADLIPASLSTPPAKRRGSIELKDKTRLWYEVTTEVLQDGTLMTATPIDATIKAEESLRSFLQTLTGTFAHLKTGLAIFDKRRQLIMFNPAFVDLTQLEPEWMVTRPSLGAIFDRLRDRSMLPEPRDYKDWRDRITAMENVPTQGLFEETWTLPDGQVYRVSARPHHDGGIALMIEDISDEVTLTRRFRSELELSQSVIDALDDAIVVFATSGLQLMANKAYLDLWGLPEEDGLDLPSILDASRHWQNQTQPAPLWGEIRDFVGVMSPREGWADNVRLTDGALLGCRIIPLSGGATLVAFSRPDPLPVFHRHPNDLAAIA